MAEIMKSILDSEYWRKIKPYAVIDPKSSKVFFPKAMPDFLVKEMDRVRVFCANPKCRKIIKPIIKQKNGFFLTPSCWVGMNIGCSRSLAAKSEYSLVVQDIISQQNV